MARVLGDIGTQPHPRIGVRIAKGLSVRDSLTTARNAPIGSVKPNAAQRAQRATKAGMREDGFVG
jgi:hypothetical protein